MLKKTSILIIITVITVSLFCPAKSYSATSLIKTPNSSAVYYVDENNIRHAFPNKVTYESWFGNDFSDVITMSEDYVASLVLGKNITLRAGKYLVKVPTAPEVYAVEPGGTLRHIVSADVMEKIYGKDWMDKLIDLPEVFFENYVVGDVIEYEYQIPDGVIYKLTNKNDYYYKIADHAKKFTSFNDVLLNGYTNDDVVEGITSFLLHAKEISGYDESLHKIVTQNNLAKHDCENKNFKGAFIFIYEDNYIKSEVNKIQDIKNNFPEHFSWATDELSKIDLENEIFKIKKQDRHDVRGEFSLKQAIYDFYDEHEDEYDFLFVFDNFSGSSKTIAEYNYVSNSVKGTHKPLLKAEVQYGSLGKLKGVVNAFNINKYYANGLDFVLNNLTHEMLHQWSGAMLFLNDLVQDDMSLLSEDEAHWSQYVNFVSPLGGLGWQDNNGTFTNQTPLDTKLKLSNLDLYAMGLLPLRGINDLFYIVPEDELIITTISGTRVDVDTDRLIRSMGKWECVVE